ncbi:MAG: hypothetical protein ACRC8Y_25045, partial [Chroococcales cyanobacterium]
MPDANLKSLLLISVSVLGRDRQWKQPLGQSRTGCAGDYHEWEFCNSDRHKPAILLPDFGCIRLYRLGKNPQ